MRHPRILDTQIVGLLSTDEMPCCLPWRRGRGESKPERREGANLPNIKTPDLKTMRTEATKLERTTQRDITLRDEEPRRRSVTAIPAPAPNPPISVERRQRPMFEPLDHSRSEIRLVTVTCGADGRLQCELTKHSLEDKPVYFALSYAWGDANDTTPITVNGRTFDATKNLAGALRQLSSPQLKSVKLWSYLLKKAGGMPAAEARLSGADIGSSDPNIVDTLGQFADRGVDGVREWLNTHGITESPATVADAVELVIRHGVPPLPLWIDAICINQSDVSEKNHQVRLMGQIYSQLELTLMWLGLEDRTSSAVLTLTKAMWEGLLPLADDGDDAGSPIWLANPIFETLIR